jgi:uncharacterized membrane protein YtjA (UPF0391 family)
MAYYSGVFFVIAIVSGGLGFLGLISSSASAILLLVGMILAVMFFVSAKNEESNHHTCITCGNKRKS